MVAALAPTFAVFAGPAVASTGGSRWPVGAPTWGLFAPDHPYDWVWSLVTICLFAVLLIKLLKKWL